MRPSVVNIAVSFGRLVPLDSDAFAPQPIDEAHPLHSEPSAGIAQNIPCLVRLIEPP